MKRSASKPDAYRKWRAHRVARTAGQQHHHEPTRVVAHVADMPKSDSERHALMPLSSRFGHLLRPRPNRAVARHSALVNPDPVAQAPSARRGLLVDVAP